MAFTAKVRVTVEEAQDGESRLTFSADYIDPATGEKLNTEWAKYTPGLHLVMTVLDQVVESNQIRTGDQFTLTFTKD